MCWPIVRSRFAFEPETRDEADVLVVAGDLTNCGQPEEMEPLLNALVRFRIPVIVVLGNHDYECDK
ncbi:MAG: metallophosphoesterase family protein [Terriglobales bacterium]